MTRHLAFKFAALALPLALAACFGGGGDGGSDGNGNGNGNGGGNGNGSGHTLSGTVSGLNETGLVLSNGSDTVTVPAGATTFTLGGSVASGAAYQVAVGTQPLWQSCSVTNGSGTMAGANVTNVAISCVSSIHISTVAGANGTTRADGTADRAAFAAPFGVAADSNGNRYVAEPAQNVVRKIAADGRVTTIGTGTAGADDGAANVATFSFPFGVAVSAAGDVYVADGGNHKIRKIASDGTVSTVAGDPLTGVFLFPAGVVVDASGNLFVADQQHHRIAKVAPDGTVTTFAGSGIPGNANGVGPAAQFNSPFALALDGSTLYVVEQSYAVRKVALADGTVSTAAGSATTAGNTDGAAADATFSGLRSIAASQGNVYVVDGAGFESLTGDRIRRIKPDGSVSTLMPAYNAATDPCCNYDGRPGMATILQPAGLAIDAAGDLLVTQQGDQPAVRKLSKTEPEVSTRAVLLLNASPYDVAADRNGNYYVSQGSRVTKVSADGAVSTLAGNAENSGFADGDAASARFGAFLNGIATDAAGNVYVIDGRNFRVRKITPDGTVSTLAGDGTEGFADGAAASAKFAGMDGLTVDAGGNVYVGDTGNCRIRKITPDGNVTTLAGSDTCGSADGVGQAAQFNWTGGLAADASGNVYVADFDSGAVRKVAPNGTVTTLPVPAGVSFAPDDVAVDASGNVYVSNDSDGFLYRIGTDGTVVHLAGARNQGATDGPRSTARFGGYLSGLTIDASGHVVLVDQNNWAVRRVSTAPGTMPPPPPPPRGRSAPRDQAASVKGNKGKQAQ